MQKIIWLLFLIRPRAATDCPTYTWPKRMYSWNLVFHNISLCLLFYFFSLRCHLISELEIEARIWVVSGGVRSTDSAGYFATLSSPCFKMETLLRLQKLHNKQKFYGRSHFLCMETSHQKIMWQPGNKYGICQVHVLFCFRYCDSSEKTGHCWTMLSHFLINPIHLAYKDQKL